MKTKHTFYGNRLTLMRMLSGLSMSELAHKSGLSKQAISKFEKGDLIPSYVVIIGFTKLFNVADDFFSIKNLDIRLIENQVEIIKQNK